jgi:multidrug resistance efflux pump
MSPATNLQFETYASQCKSWVERQARLLPSTVNGCVYIHELSDTGEQSHKIFETWPQGSGQPAHFHQACKRAELENKGIILTFKESDDSHHRGRNCVHIALPCTLDNNLVLVCAFELYPENKSQLQRSMQQLEWGLNWLKQELTSQTGGLETPPIFSAQTIQKKVQEQSLLKDAAQQLVNELETLFNCIRVSIGSLHRQQVKILTISHQSTIDNTSPVIINICHAMEECYDQKSVIIFPPPTGEVGPITGNHEKLSKNHGSPVIISHPIIESAYGEGFILLLERKTPEIFSAGELQLLQSIVDTAGPVLTIKSIGSQNLISFARNKLTERLHTLSLKRKVAVYKTLTVLLILLFIFFAKSDFRVETDVTLSGTILRGIVAPFPGYVAEAQKSAGDHVEEGETLALLDTSDLTLDELTWRSKYSQAELEYRKAIADNATSHAKIINQQKKQAEIQLSLLQLKKKRAAIKAPFTGSIVTGDLSQSIGGPVEKGKLLFEIVPDSGFKLLAQVDEKDISFIKIGQSGTVVFNSLPKDTFNFSVSKITPIATAENGHTSFRVEAGLQDTTRRLSPGMTGYGKILVGKKPLIWLWTRPLRERLQLLIWKLRP